MSVKELNQPTQSYHPESYPVTPYDRAREEWDNRIGSARVQALNWRLCALVSITLCLVLAIGLIYQSSKSMVTPYVVQVGSDGTATAIGPARESKYVPQEKEIKYFLSQVVQKARTIPLDPVIAKQNWLSVYAFLRQSAANKMSQIVKVEEPLKKIGTETVQVDINVVVAMSKDTYQIRWREDVYSKEGALKDSYWMTGLFTFDFSTPRSEKELLQNPLGLYIKDFSWSKELTKGGKN
ncbi:MAG TPA: conjugal transfer protein TrbF [Bacillota bacterium]|jgi:type IV secretory pathway TrbF-like protein|nr:conjugal transfer protein TrbF [Bacillota bacterium]HOL09888.1 conjugal transfer protein TrbF [Bacillota bacterium]HPO98665.1 conjugal transfer protein TrbF [Bacillota bacterium]